VLQRKQQLTYLELGEVVVLEPAQDQPTLEPLPSLVELRLDQYSEHAIGLAGTHLTRVDVHLKNLSSQDVLAGKTLLQHLDLACADFADQFTQVLSQLQLMQQLTHLGLRDELLCRSDFEDHLPAAAYSALTARSKLQHPDISTSCLPPGAWQHIFRNGRALTRLTSVDISRMKSTESVPGDWPRAPAPEGNLIVSCCPGLHYLGVEDLTDTPQLLGPLQRLNSLHTLALSLHYEDSESATTGCLQANGQLTGLRGLKLKVPQQLNELPKLQLAQLKQLTALTQCSWGSPHSTSTLQERGGLVS
jgi:hypothetical protein